MLALASLADVRALCGPLLHSALALKHFLLVFVSLELGLFLPLVFELLASCRTYLTAQPLFCRFAPSSIACVTSRMLLTQ
jgi:hypothetical protein